MRLRCPHCQHALEIVLDAPSDPIKCPSCGSQLPGLADTAEYRRPLLQTIGHFELQERVGRGHFGDVYRARDTKLDRIVAVKIPRTDRTDDGTLRLFLHEARAAAQLRHANIVRVYDVDREGDVIYIVSDFIRGVTLADQMESRRFEPQAAAQLCATVAEALHFAHEAGVVHRDLKPGNIMLDDEGQPHLMDFGLAKQDSSEISITTSGDILGTPAYMSPEQARGDSRHADRRSDVYSLGVVLFQMISGEHPFAGDSVTLIRRVASDEPAPLHRISEKLPRDLATICLKAMSKDPARRYATAQDMADDLRRYLRGDPIQARRASRLERSWRWARKNPMVVITSAAALAASVLLAVALSWIAGNYGIANAGTPQSASIGDESRPLPRRTVISTKPAGATVVFIPLDPTNGRPHAEKKIEAQAVAGSSQVSADLLPGDYLVVAHLDDGRFHEVFRRVPSLGAGLPDARRHLESHVTAKGEVELFSITIPESTVAEGMARFEGHPEFTLGVFQGPLSNSVPAHQVRVPGFLLDVSEFTVDDCREQEPSLIDKRLSAQQAPGDYPLVYVYYDDAVVLAERAGKRLPEEAEYEFAATRGGTLAFPWGNDAARLENWAIGRTRPEDFQLRDSQPVVFGLYSNAAEWTSSWSTLYPTHRALRLPEPDRHGLTRIVRGGPDSVINGDAQLADLMDGPRTRIGLSRWSAKPGLGFRGARSLKPRLTPEDFVRPLD